MTLLPQLQQALVDAAAAPPRRTRPRAGVVARPLLALAVLALLLVVAAPMLRPPDRGADALREAPPESVATVPTAAIARAAALAAAPSPGGESGISAPDELVAFARRLQIALPYPPGLADDGLVPLITRQTAARTMSGVSVKGDVRLEAEYRASCTWERFWLAAQAAGDGAALVAATEVLQLVPAWPTFRRSQAVPKDVAVAARSGDAAPIQRQVDLNCSFAG